MDILDATSLPLGVAALCKNCKFMLTGVECRWGFQTQMQSPNADAQITGGISGIYTAENPGEVRFQVPMIFDSDGYLLKESPVGTGRMVRIQGAAGGAARMRCANPRDTSTELCFHGLHAGS